MVDKTSPIPPSVPLEERECWKTDKNWTIEENWTWAKSVFISCTPDPPEYRNWISQENWTVDRNWGWAKPLKWDVLVKERFGLNDKIANLSEKKAHTNIFIVENKTVFQCGKNVNERLKTADAALTKADINRKFNEHMRFILKGSRSLKKYHEFSFIVNDKRPVVKFDCLKNNKLTIGEQLSNVTTFNRSSLEKFKLADSDCNSIEKYVKRNLSFDERRGSIVGLNKSERVTALDSCLNVVSFVRNKRETFSFFDSLSKNIDNNSKERFRISSLNTSEVVTQKREKFGVTARYDDILIYDRRFESVLYTRDWLNKQTNKTNNEILEINDYKSCEFTLPNHERFRLSTAFGKAFIYDRRFGEKFNLRSINQKSYSSFTQEYFKTYDALGKSGQGVYSDILFENPSTWTVDEIKRYVYKGKHVGYEHFRPFIYGDYNYQNALFRTVVHAESNDRALLEQFQIAVDVPDIVDRGSAEVVDKNFDLVVKFNKYFNVAPEVTVTMRSGVSGTPIVPNIIKIDENGFTVHLLNALTGEKAEGRFIWTAVGY